MRVMQFFSNNFRFNEISFCQFSREEENWTANVKYIISRECIDVLEIYREIL